MPNLPRAELDQLAQLLSSRLAGSELTRLLLEVFDVRAGATTPPELLRRAARHPAFAAAAIDARLLNRIDRLALDAAPDFQALELAPVGPLGSNTVLGGIHQNNVLATVRGSEVLADPTTALALEAARRRRAARASGGRGPSEPRARAERLVGELVPRLRALCPGLAVVFSPRRLEALGYYRGPCLKLWLRAADGEELAVADGGFVDWTARLLADRKESALTSGIGTQFLAARFAASGA